jgi:hypothetical protein
MEGGSQRGETIEGAARAAGEHVEARTACSRTEPRGGERFPYRADELAHVNVSDCMSEACARRVGRRVRLAQRCTRLGLAVATVIVLVLVYARAASAQSRTAFLAEKLQFPPPRGQSDDFRVRTNAALQLGASDDDAAVQPLCRSLANDPSDVVRQAGAAALRRLARPAALPCLRARQPTETNAQVKLQITRAIEAIEAAAPSGASAGGSAAGGLDEPPKFVKDAKYYVRISRISHNLSRPQPDVERVVVSALRSKLESLGRYQLAPANESADQAKAVIAKRKLKGFELMVTVDETYTDGTMRVRVKVAILTYPGKALQGEVNPGASTSARQGDRGVQDTLITMCAEKAMEQFSQNFM